VSRIGKRPIAMPAGVTMRRDGESIYIKGPKGELYERVSDKVTIALENNELSVTRSNDEAESRSQHGLMRTLIANMVQGVTDGFTQRLEIVGVGFRAELRGNALLLNLGYSHPIMLFPPAEIKIEVPTPTTIAVSGASKQLVGAVAAKIRSFRPPEPYKGKGIKYEGEQIRRKAGKSAGK
jgi:large subunit ribosomal protein L6